MEPVRWGLIGAGDICVKRVAPALRDSDLCEFVGVTRKQKDKAQSFADEFGAGKVYQDVDEMLADDDIEAVYISTPVNLHHTQTLAAAEAGKQVLCEKPMALDAGKAEEMIGACRQYGVRLGIAYYRRFYPAVNRMMEIIESGEIGRVILAEVLAFEYYQPSDEDPRWWFIDPEQSGGGPLIDFGSHRIDLFLYMLGKISEVTAFCDTLHHERPTEDQATCLFRMKSGAQAILSVSNAIGPPSDSLRILGTEGEIRAENLNSGEFVFHRNHEDETISLPNPENTHQPLIEDFCLAVREKRAPKIPGETGFETTRIIGELYRSAKEGLVVKL
ncbi:Gfo/Idh/MocA family protein [candidate division KSB1 bacterium]